MNDWVLCWRFQTSAVNNKRVVTAEIFLADKKSTILSPIPVELQKYKELLTPQVFDTYIDAESYSKEVTKKMGFRYIE